MMSEFGRYLKGRREENGLSLSEAAKLIPCTKSHLHDLESGKSCNPTILILAGIASAYGLELGDVAEAWASSLDAFGYEFRRAVRDLRHAKQRVETTRP